MEYLGVVHGGEFEDEGEDFWGKREVGAHGAAGRVQDW